MKLSDRLLMIAGNIEKGESAADIGTDHGFLPLYLWENKISPKVVFADISPGSLQKAKDTCKEFYPDETFDFRLGNGLDVLERGEVDAITIAGMGGLLMCEMLDWDMEKSISFKKYVLQPRNNPGKLRQYLAGRGFVIEKDQLVREGKFICEILTVKSPDSSASTHIETSYDDFAFAEFPDMILENETELLVEYLEMHLKKQRHIKQRIISGRGFSCHPVEDEELRAVRLRTERLEKLLAQVKGENNEY